MEEQNEKGNVANLISGAKKLRKTEISGIFCREGVKQRTVVI